MTTPWTRTEESAGEDLFDSVNTISDTLDIVAATGITAAQYLGFNVIKVRSSTGADCDISANPQIAAGDDGRILQIVGTDDTRTVTFDDGDGLKLQNGSVTLGDNEMLTLRYVTDTWVQTDSVITLLDGLTGDILTTTNTKTVTNKDLSSATNTFPTTLTDEEQTKLISESFT